MSDLVRKTVSLGFGLLGLTREKAEKVVGLLVERGELGRDAAKGFLQTLIDRGEQERSQLREIVRGEFQRLVTELGLATRQDLVEFEARLREQGGEDQQ